MCKKEKVALVTGASRGVGKGIALGLASQGVTVYLTGRTEKDSADTLPFFKGLNIHQTVKEIQELGGKGIALPCDHRDDSMVKDVFQRIQRDYGHLDLLVNNAWAGAEHVMQPYFWNTPFWEQPTDIFDDFYTVGLRSSYISCRHFAKLMTPQKQGLIVNISYSSARHYWLNVSHGVFKAATDKMTADMAHELSDHGIHIYSLHPGAVSTEGMTAASEKEAVAAMESPLSVGLCVAGLLHEKQTLPTSGSVLSTAELREKYHLS